MSKYDVEINVDVTNDSHSMILRQIRPNSSVLEFGPATGRMTQYMSEVLRCSVFIVEIDKQSFEQARQWAVDGVCGNIEDCKWRDRFCDKKFDYILFADVLEHLSDPANVLLQARTLLKEEGEAIVSVPNMAHSGILAELFQNQFQYRERGLLDKTHVHFFAYQSLVSLFNETGYRITVYDATYCPLKDSEFKTIVPQLTSDQFDFLKSKSFGDIYQFIFTAVKKEYFERNGELQVQDMLSISEENKRKITGKRQQCRVYFDCGTGLSEENSIRLELIDRQPLHQKVQLPKDCKTIRFDPIEGMGCLVWNLKVRTESTFLSIAAHNGIQFNDIYIFRPADPQFYIDNLPADSCWLYIDAEIILMDQIAWIKMVDEVGELEQQRQNLNRQLTETLDIYNITSKQLAEVQDAYNVTSRQLAEVQGAYNITSRQLIEAQNAYNIISNAFFWKITKPLRVALDAIKRLLKSNYYTFSFFKRVKNLKANGFRETLRRGKAYRRMKGLLKEAGLPAELLFEENQDFSGKLTDIKALALYLPQFHTIKENDEWWGKGFTEWTNVKKGRPRFENHYQPREPLEEFGYYDLSDIQTLKKQVALAKQHGIYGFAIYYYWFSGHRLLEKPMDMLLEHPEIDFPFMAVWANENWTRTWDGLESSILIEQKYSEEDPEHFISEIKKYLDDKRYIRVDGKPVIGVYAPQSIPNVKEVLKRWRSMARTCGIGEILIWICAADMNTHQIGIEDDIDGEYEFPPRGKGDASSCDVPQQGIAYNYNSLCEKERTFDISGRKIPVYRGSMTQWDNSARKKHNYNCWINCSPEKFYLWNRINVKYLREHMERDRRFLFINAWNEWGEGTYLEPDKKYGYAYINALSKAIMDIPYQDSEVESGKDGEAGLRYLGGGASEDIVSSWNKELMDSEEARIAVQAHVFYPEMLGDITEKVNHIPYAYDLYVSTTDEDKAKQIRLYLEKNCYAKKVAVEVFPNKGRDVAPFIWQMKPIIKNYQYFCHLHTKKSLHNSLGDVWREYLYENLLGSPVIVMEILHLFESDQQIGVVFPDNLDVVRHFVEWGSNKEIAENLLRRMNLEIDLPNDIIFPAGNMFWGRTAAVHNLFDTNYTDEDFPEEGAQVDGTMMHAIERLWLYVSKANGYRYQRTRCLVDNRPIDLFRD